VKVYSNRKGEANRCRGRQRMQGMDNNKNKGRNHKLVVRMS